MTVLTPGGWLQNAGATHPAYQLRHLVSSAFAGTRAATSLVSRGGVHPNAGNVFAVTQTGSPSMAVLVKSGICWVPGTENGNQGAYGFINDADVNLAIAAAHATLARIDIVVAKVEDTQYSGGVNAPSLAVVTGTPSGSPVVPSAPNNSIILAQIAVGAAVTSITNANITDRRFYLAGVGGAISVANQTERDALTGLHNGQIVWRRDQKRFDVSDGASAWELIGPPVLLKGLLLINNGNPVATTSGTTEMNMALYALTGLTLVTNRYYKVRLFWTFTKTVAGDTFDMKLRANTAVSGTIVSGSATDQTDAHTIGNRITEMVFQGNSSWTSLHFSVQRSAGSGTFSYYSATGGTRGWAELYDLGSNWSNVS